MWIQSSSDWGILLLSALLIGMSKTGIQGISLLAVPMMAMTFLVVLLVMFWSDWKGKENTLSSHWWYGPYFWFRH